MRLLAWALVAVVLGAAGGTASAAADPVPGTRSRAIEVGTVTRAYLIHLPPGRTGSLPVVIAFHGSATTADQVERMSGFSVLADREGFVAVYPKARGRSWHVSGTPTEEIAFLRALVDDLGRSVTVDRRRVFATGASNGANMAWRLACSAPDLVAGVGLVAGAYPQVCGPERPPAIVFHGTADRLFPYQGKPGFMPVWSFAAAWGAPADCAEPTATARLVYRKGDAIGEWWACGRQQAILYTLAGKGHTWPGSPVSDPTTSRDVDASLEMWRFFRGLPPR